MLLSDYSESDNDSKIQTICFLFILPAWYVTLFSYVKPSPYCRSRSQLVETMDGTLPHTAKFSLVVICCGFSFRSS